MLLKSPKVIIFLLLQMGGLSAGTTSDLQGQQLLRGQVVRGTIPVTDGYVMLHSVTSLRAGQVDSISLDQNGSFVFELPGFGNIGGLDEVYFASVEYQGVLYFGGAVTEVSQLENFYSIEVFMAKNVPKEGVVLPLKVRNILLEETTNTWKVRDVMALDNFGGETLVPTGDGVVWNYPLPSGFQNPEVVRGELPPEDVGFTDEGVFVRAPLPPGERMLVIVYELPELSTTFPAPGPTGIVELFVKEPGPSLEITELSPLDVVSLEPGSTYRRYSGSNLNETDISLTAVIELEPYPLGRISLAIGILLICGVLIFGQSKSDDLISPKVTITDERKSIVLRIAQLDQLLKSVRKESDIGDLKAKRKKLLDQLREKE